MQERKATITRIYGATQSAKNGKFYLAAQATSASGDSVLGQGVESAALYNIALTTLGEGIMDLLQQDETNPNVFRAVNPDAELNFDVTLRDVREHAEKENTFWATV